MNDHTEVEIDEEKKWDRVNGVRPVEALQMVTVKIPVDAPDAGDKDAPKGSIGQPHLGPVTPEMKKELRQKCRGSHGITRKQCMMDIVMGRPAVEARRSLRRANLLGKELSLKRCLAIDNNNFGIYNVNELPKPETPREGTAVAFWWKPEANPTQRCIMMEKGKDFFITQVGNALSVGAGDAHCTTDNVFQAGKWTPITVTVHKSGSLQVFVNSVPTCAVQQQKNRSNSKNVMVSDPAPLLVGGADGADTCKGLMAHIYYIPQAVTVKEAEIHGKIDPFKCERPHGNPLFQSTNSTSPATAPLKA